MATARKVEFPRLVGPVPTCDAANLKRNWKNLSKEPEEALACLMRSVVLAYAMADDGFRQRWCDEKGEPKAAVLAAAASLPFMFHAPDLVKRLRRLDCTAQKIANGNGKKPVTTAAEIDMLNDATKAKLARKMARELGIRGDFSEPFELPDFGDPVPLPSFE